MNRHGAQPDEVHRIVRYADPFRFVLELRGHLVNAQVEVHPHGVDGVLFDDCRTADEVDARVDSLIKTLRKLKRPARRAFEKADRERFRSD